MEVGHFRYDRANDPSTRRDGSWKGGSAGRACQGATREAISTHDRPHARHHRFDRGRPGRVRSATQLWASFAFTLTLGLLTISVLAAFYRCGHRGAFCVGFSACGWSYLVMCFAPWFEGFVGPSLSTTAVLDFLYPVIRPAASPNGREALYSFGSDDVISAVGPGSIAPRSCGWRGSGGSPTGHASGRSSCSAPGRFRRIGHSIFAVVAAFLGGFIARRLYFTGECGTDHGARHGDRPRAPADPAA